MGKSAFLWQWVHGLRTMSQFAFGISFMGDVGLPHRVCPGKPSRCHVVASPVFVT
jgi:hypothetical protein